MKKSIRVRGVSFAFAAAAVSLGVGVGVAPSALAQSAQLPAGSIGSLGSAGERAPEAEECSISATATSATAGGGYGDVDSRTGGVDSDKAIFRIDGWGSPDKAFSRVIIGSADELENVVLTFEFDPKLTSPANGKSVSPGIAPGVFRGVTDTSTANVALSGNTAKITIPKLEAGSSIAFEFSSTPAANASGPFTNSATVTAGGLESSGVCPEPPEEGPAPGSLDGILGSLGSVLPSGGSLQSLGSGSATGSEFGSAAEFEAGFGSGSGA